ncbi:MGMT family protein [Marinilabiliaceae bacterium ANBcel2]|nr:MGMT family protein [Marinilabiliaceae bacterium ANBcel2]
MTQNKSFCDNVVAIVKQIPKGRVTSYGAIAAALGMPRSARMVGYILNNGLFKGGEFIPAHRIVNRNGYLTGKHAFPGEQMMQELLENEGVIISDNRVVEFKKLFWNPASL